MGWIEVTVIIIVLIIGYKIYNRFKYFLKDFARQKGEIRTLVEKLGANDEKLKERDEIFNILSLNHVKLTAKYHEKLKAAEVKKKNLSKYRKKKKEIKTIKGKVEDIVGKEPKWVDHSLSGPMTHKMGKPKGSAGGGRKRPEKIHSTIDLVPNRCHSCKTSLENVKEYLIYDSIRTELSRVKDEADCYDILALKNVKQNIFRKKCPTCKKWVYPDQGIFKNARFGPRFISYVISKRIDTSMPYETLISDLSKMFGKEFSLTDVSIINWFKRFEVQIKAVYDQLKKLIQSEKFLHIDETGLPMNGENWWLWIICCANLVLYKHSNSRGHQSIKDVIDEFKGTIIADFFSAYEKFDGNEHQKCLAHLLSDIIELLVRLKKENGRIEKKIQKHEKSIVLKDQLANPDVQSTGKKKRGRKPKLEILEFEEVETLNIRFKQNQGTMNQAVKLGAFFRAPFKDTCFSWKKPNSERISKEDAEEKCKNLVEELRKEGITEPDLERILKRIDKYMDQLFTYLQMEGMPPDNNPAERGLRKFSRQRKISGDFKSEELIEHFTQYLSLYMTCEKNDQDFEELVNAILSGESVDLRSFLFSVQ